MLGAVHEGIITLTKQEHDVVSTAADCEKLEAGAPDRLICAALRLRGQRLLTADMIAAGVYELLSRDLNEDLAEAVVRDVFQAIPDCGSFSAISLRTSAIMSMRISIASVTVRKPFSSTILPSGAIRSGACDVRLPRSLDSCLRSIAGTIGLDDGSRHHEPINLANL